MEPKPYLHGGSCFATLTIGIPAVFCRIRIYEKYNRMGRTDRGFNILLMVGYKGEYHEKFAKLTSLAPALL